MLAFEHLVICLSTCNHYVILQTILKCFELTYFMFLLRKLVYADEVSFLWDNMYKNCHKSGLLMQCKHNGSYHFTLLRFCITYDKIYLRAFPHIKGEHKQNLENSNDL